MDKGVALDKVKIMKYIWLVIGIVLSQILYRVLKDILPSWFFYALIIVAVISILIGIR